MMRGVEFALLAAPAAAAPRLREALSAAPGAWERHVHPRPLLSFATSSAGARQIEAGAPADLFVSADEEWMDDLARHALLAPTWRATGW